MTMPPDAEPRPPQQSSAAEPGLSATLHDWRVEDGDASDLTERERQPWALTVKPGGYGYVLDLAGPAGRTCTVALEIDRGAVVLRTYREDRPDVKLSVTAGATEVESPEEAGCFAGRRLTLTPDTAAWTSGRP